MATDQRCSGVTTIGTFVLLIALVATDIEAAFHTDSAPVPSSRSLVPRPRRQWRQQHGLKPWSMKSSPFFLSFSADNVDEVSSSVDFAMDPDSDEAKEITARLGLSSLQHEQLSQLASLVVEWNDRINLVSRRDCTVEVVFGRHVLPSIALATDKDEWIDKQVIDVGTGGGFPGLPLAIVYPETQFMLVDSVGKKLKAVEDMANELDLTNVRVHHGRAEEMVDDILEGSRHQGAYDVCVGRSVAALPKFCFWISELIKPEEGRLVYIIGGDLPSSLLSQAESNVAIDDVLQQEGTSDKRILIFSQKAVASIAASSGEVKQKRGKPKPKVQRTSKKAKGQWTRRDKPKNRGYDDFKRFSTD